MSLLPGLQNYGRQFWFPRMHVPGVPLTHTQYFWWCHAILVWTCRNTISFVGCIPMLNGSIMLNHVKSISLQEKISTHLDSKTHTYVGIETPVVCIKHRSIGFWWQNPIFCSSFTLFRIVKSKHVVCQWSQPVAFSVWNPICCNWNPTRTPASHCCPETFCGVLVSDMKSQGLPLRLWNEWTWSPGAQLENIETIWYEYMLCLLCVGLSKNLLVYARMEGYPKTVI